MAEITGGELIVRCLAKEGIKRIFGITDSGYHPVMGSAEPYGIRWVSPRHEAAAAHMADGVFKSSGEIPIVMAGGGPGTANLVSGIICSMSEGVPVIAITAQRRSQVVYPARTGVYQALDQQDVFRPITKWNAVVHAWNRIPELLQTAFREAMAGRPGPVQIDIPDDIMYETGEEDSVKLLAPNQYRPPLPEPSERQITEAARLISEAENPLLMPGTGVLNSEGWDALSELAELLNCPVTCTAAGNTALPHDHPCYIKPYSEPWLQARKESDLILAIGTCLGELDLPFDEYFGDPDKQKLIHVDIDPRNIGANRPISMGIVADARATLKALVTHLKKMAIKPADGKRLRKYKTAEAAQWAGGLASYKDYDGDKIHPVQSIQAAREVFPADAINVADGGNTALFNSLYIKLFKPRTSLGLFEFGHLGTGIPSAIGAKIANPDKDVFVITGDGAAGFNFMEMVTAVREKAKITVIVHAEESWCMEEIAQIFTIGDPEKLVAVKQAPVRWDKMAEAMGCHGEYVDKPEDLIDAFTRAKNSELPAVVCVKTDKEVNLMPPSGELFEQVYEGPSET
jgi:acetolactate synthase-1/2/3 large subunit